MLAGWEGFAPALVQWQLEHGRHDLPWQKQRDPYRVWLSEIMLQQTQVATVRGYFERFLAQLPTVQALAQAPAQQIMALWSGLGYYSRARNLHACAQRIVSDFGGVFPREASVLATLPGIGRSTASAITSVCFGERVPILDANARRVVARVQGFDQDLAVAAHERALWALAQQLLPAHSAQMPAYTQAVMDLGASICAARNPQCGVCPVSTWCRAHQGGAELRIPVRTRKLVRRSVQWFMLLAYAPDGSVWLERRPSPGIWAGMDCLPIADSMDALQALARKWFGGSANPQPLDVVSHTLTHRDLYLHPVALALPQCLPAATEAGSARWVAASQWPSLGLPAPIRRLLQTAELAIPTPGAA